MLFEQKKMARETKSIAFFRQKIISYYEVLVNKIDIQTERWLLLDKIRKSKNGSNILNARRNEWIERIELQKKKNLLHLENNANLETLNSLLNDEDKLNSVLFQDGFLFFTHRKPYSERGSFYIGKLIYKNCYLNKNELESFE